MKEINNELLDYQYNLIERFFKETSEEFDELDYDGEALKVWFENEIIEEYSYEDLCEIIDDFEKINND